MTVGRRWRATLAASVTLLVMGACSENGLVDSSEFGSEALEGPQFSTVPGTQFDAPDPRAGVFTVCKVGTDALFRITVGTEDPFERTILNGTCQDVVTNPGAEVQVQIFEVVPDGFQLVQVWAQSVADDGTPLLPWEDHGTENPISGAIESQKDGCVAVFFNERIPTGAGAGTPGYWKTHPEAWPYTEITIGGTTYSREAAIDLMEAPTAGDKWLNMFEQVVAAKLNLAIGTDPTCISTDLTAADTWLGTEAGNRKIRASSATWQGISSTFTKIDDYNNGFLCAPSRD